jgi:hypothetical protein
VLRLGAPLEVQQLNPPNAATSGEKQRLDQKHSLHLRRWLVAVLLGAWEREVVKVSVERTVRLLMCLLRLLYLSATNSYHNVVVLRLICSIPYARGERGIFQVPLTRLVTQNCGEDQKS